MSSVVLSYCVAFDSLTTPNFKCWSLWLSSVFQQTDHVHIDLITELCFLFELHEGRFFSSPVQIWYKVFHSIFSALLGLVVHQPPLPASAYPEGSSQGPLHLEESLFVMFPFCLPCILSTLSVVFIYVVTVTASLTCRLCTVQTQIASSALWYLDASGRTVASCSSVSTHLFPLRCCLVTNDLSCAGKAWVQLMDTCGWLLCTSKSIDRGNVADNGLEANTHFMP